MNFDTAFDRLLGHEGRYSNDPDDPGGETNWGISKRSYPALDIKNLTREQAKQIYLNDFWTAGQMEQFHPAIAFQVFDAAVNHGIRRACKLLQQASGTVQDGVIGAVTVKAIRSRDLNDMLLLFIAYRQKYWTSLDGWPKYGRGWANRNADNMIYAAGDN